MASYFKKIILTLPLLILISTISYAAKMCESCKKEKCCKALIKKNISLPSGRGGHAAAVIDGHIFIVGGTDWSEDHKEKFWLDDSIYFSENLWQKGPELPHPLAYSLFASDESGIYLAGGTDGSRNLKTVYYLDGIKGSWKILKPLPEALCSGSGALLNRKLYVTSGWTDNGITNEMWVLNLDRQELQWQSRRKLPGPERAFPAFAVCGDFIYLFGGMAPEDNSLNIFNDAYRYNPDNDSWTKLKDLPFEGYGWSACAVDGSHILLAGKVDGKIHKDIYLIDVRNMNTKKIGESIIQTTTAPLIKVKPNEFWLIGGEPDSNKNRTKIITSIILADK